MIPFQNIIPIILLNIFIIFFFEGILYFTYALDTQKQLLSTYLQNILNNIKNFYNLNNNAILSKFGNNNNNISNIINSNSRNEKNNITSTFTIAVVIYTFTLVSILFILGIYLYLLHRFTNLIIDWKTIFIVLLIVNIFIILYELLYLFFILIKKQFNSNEITYELINMFL